MAISLSKGQSVDLSKTAPGLSKVIMGLGWDPVKKRKSLFGFGGGDDVIDLDASCLLFDASGQVVDTVWFRQLASRDGAVQHTGDNLTGAGEGDDEQIKVNLSKLSAGVAALAFTVNSFRGQTFNEVENAFCRVVDEANGKELCRFALAEKGGHTGVVMAVLSRKADAWSLKAVGAPASGRTAIDLASAAASHL